MAGFLRAREPPGDFPAVEGVSACSGLLGGGGGGGENHKRPPERADVGLKAPNMVVRVEEMEMGEGGLMRIQGVLG